MQATANQSMEGKCNPSCVVSGEHYRFSVLSPMLIRLEYSEDGVFEDRPSIVAVNRLFDVPDFRVAESEKLLEIDTAFFHLYYRKGAFTPDGLYIDAKNRYTNYGARWRFGEAQYGNPPRHHNLYGTARTLDKMDGAVPLDFGLIDRSGRTFLDDSKTFLFEADGSLKPRRNGNLDVYFFSYGHDYFEALRQYYHLTGRPPMLPRYALGNWWSRYHDYTDNEYNELMDRMAREDLPFSVAVLDMDWHVTDVEPQYGRGWTGYTWNRKLFPEPEAFLRGMHRRNLHVSLNLHPADGVQPCEEAYPRVARDMGIPPESNRPVPFDFTDPKFIEVYFRDLLHPLEAQGADVWWIDWQQGTHSGLEGLDPLWLLNHYHYLDSCRNGKRGMILSRYSGYGSQRYPLGFSGDTVATWNSLQFQPYFTATAVNVGYPWWSHDIGGFTRGSGSRELLIRWIQFGVFSPILRLHSSSNPYCLKEPWLLHGTDYDTVKRYLQLRYELIPYFYTAIANCHLQGTPQIHPIYYRYPDAAEAYDAPNQYFFGSELMVCPITSARDAGTGMGSVNAWIPEGVWTDFFTGHTYRGGHRMILNRPLDRQCVLSKPGAIVPLAVRKANETGNPEALRVLVFPGGEGSFTLYEDSGDGTPDPANALRTTFTLSKTETGTQFRIHAEGNFTVIPEKRSFELCFRGFEPFALTADEPFVSYYDRETRTQHAVWESRDPSADLCVTLSDPVPDRHADAYERVRDFLISSELPILLKNKVDEVCRMEVGMGERVQALHAIGADPATVNVICELMFS